MLIRPHDAPIDDDEWRNLVADHPFGTLIAPGTNRELPIVVPTHIHFDGDDTIRLHLAKPNPVWTALRENPRCLFVVVAAVTYVPTSWEAPPGTPPPLRPTAPAHALPAPGTSPTPGPTRSPNPPATPAPSPSRRW